MGSLRPVAACVLSAAALLPPPALAGESALERRAGEVRALVAKEPRLPEGLFDPVFLREVPPAALLPVLTDIHARHGAMKGIRLLREEGPHRGRFEAAYEDGWSAEVDLGLAAEPPHRVTFLYFHPPVPGFRTLEEGAAAVARLPGRHSFGVYALDGKEPRPLVESRGEEALAVGSAFKLYVLGALAMEVADGRRRFEDPLRLEARWRSGGSGIADAWPDGAPVTLHTATTLMISRSDNTATDHLLFTLGRERVEAALGAMGNGAVARNTPFLSTAEMFKLKWTDGGKPGRAYLALDAKERRAYLEKEVAGMALRDMDTPLHPAPRFLDSIEWFASARDLARAVDWLRRNSDAGPAAAVRGILAVNEGLPEAKHGFAWAGFKGGSEPGVLNLTFLLRTRSGRWLAVAATWNDPEAPLEEERLEVVLRRVLQILGREER